MRLLKIISTLVLFSTLSAIEIDEYVKFNIDLSYVNLSRTIDSSTEVVSSQVNPILNTTFTALLFPNKYDLKLSYTHNLTNNVDSNLYNPKNYDDSVNHMEISVVPFYNPTFGGLGIFYTSAEQNSNYTNKTDTSMGLSQYDWTNSSKTMWGLMPIADDLGSNQSYQSKEEMSYLGVKYMLPEYKYLPKGANIYYSIMDRTTVYYGTLGNENHLIYISGEGRLYGFGLQRELYELPQDEFSIDLFQLSAGGFSGFPDLNLYEFSGAITYKSEIFYTRVMALVYIAEEFNGTLHSEALNIPRLRDALISLKVGAHF